MIEKEKLKTNLLYPKTSLRIVSFPWRKHRILKEKDLPLKERIIDFITSFAIHSQQTWLAYGITGEISESKTDHMFVCVCMCKGEKEGE